VLLGIGTLLLAYWLIRLPIEWRDWKLRLRKGVWRKGCEPSFSEVLFNRGFRSRPFEQFAIDETNRLMRMSPTSYGLPSDHFTKLDANTQTALEATQPIAERKDDEFEAFRDPRGKSLRELFEMAAFWAIVWSCAFGIGILVAWVIAWVAPSGQMGGFGVFLPYLAGFAAVLAILIAGDVETRARLTRRFVSRYAFPVTLAAGIVIGWQWREHRPPEDDDQAKSMAWHACAEMPDCIRRAEQLNGGGAVGYFIRPKG